MASIRKIQDSYKITVTTGRDAQGRQIRYYKTWKPEKALTARQTEKELKRIVYEFERDIALGYQVDNRQTFSEYADYFIQVNECKPQTMRSRKFMIGRINEYIGHMRLVDIRPQHINAMYKELQKPGQNRRVFAHPLVDFNTLGKRTALAKQCGVAITVIQRLCAGKTCSKESSEKISKALGRNDLFQLLDDNKTLSTRTVRGFHDMLVNIFGQAEKEMIIPYNPAKKAKPPKLKRSDKKKCLQPEELERVIEALQTESIRTKTLITMYAVTGCRRGEIIGLKWSKVDLFNRVITIDTSLNYTPEMGIFEGSTKTDNVRQIGITPALSRLLVEYRKWQDGEREKWGDLWQNTDYVFTNQRGGAIQANYINWLMIEFCKAHDLPHIHPHMFRHTAASIMIARGIDILTVSKILGHDDVSTTLNTYGHEIEEAKKEAIECVTDVILHKRT